MSERAAIPLGRLGGILRRQGTGVLALLPLGGGFSPRSDQEAALVPAASIAGRSLVTVIAIMSFLCGLTAGAGLMIQSASRDWRREVASEITIQVRPLAGRDVDTEVAKAAAIARGVEGVASLEIYGKAESEKLLEPWLGSGLDLGELPVPRMVAVKLEPGHHPDLADLRQRLTAGVAGVSLDDHQIWFAWLATMANTVVVVAAAIFALVLAAMFMTVAFATRGAMAGNQEIIGVLHFVGAEDRFIAREFQGHFLRLGLRGGAIGGGAAIVAFLLAGMLKARLADSPGGEQLEALFGSFALGFRGYLVIVGITLSIAVATGVVSRSIVYRNLQRLQ